MSQTKFPSLNNALAGFEFKQQAPGQSIDVDYQALEIACVDLISKLENLMTRSNEMDRDDFIDESGGIARKMLELLMSFSNEFLANGANQAREEIDRALTFADAYDEVLKTRPLTNAVLRAFWKVDESKDIQASHAELGDALVRACAASFYPAVLLIGMDQAFGKEIDQSTVVLVKQLQKLWN